MAAFDFARHAKPFLNFTNGPKNNTFYLYLLTNHEFDGSTRKLPRGKIPTKKTTHTCPQ